MTFQEVFRLIRAWPAQALAAVLIALLPAVASAGTLTATATVTPTANSNGTTHYAIALTATGSDNISTLWFAWIPGAFCLTAQPMNVTAPSGWTGPVTPLNGDFAIEWFSGTNPIMPGQTLTGFSFDSAETPAQIAQQCPQAPSITTLTSFVYANSAGSGFSIPPGDGAQIVPTLTAATLPPSPAVASVLPGGRSVQVGTMATVFATMMNSSASGLSNCKISLPSSAPSGLSMTYQTTNSMTNALTGTPNTPVAIGANGSQSFLLSFSGNAAFDAPGLPLVFGCDGSQPVTTIAGVNTVDLLFSSSPIPDIIALAATAGNNGIVTAPTSSAGAFAVASANVGVAGTITVSTDTGSATLPLVANVCQTNPMTGACMATPTGSLTVSDSAGATPTFSVFVDTSAPIALDPANSRIFLRFKDSSGTSHGSTSVAVDTN